MSVASGPECSKLAEEVWDTVADGYRTYWSPRLRPFIETAVAAFHPRAPGPIAVPGCGPGAEVLLLARKHPKRAIVATDPSRAMLASLWKSLRDEGITSVVASPGTAETLTGSVLQASGVFSSCVLQLLADPLAALAEWRRALRSGGVATVLYWPRPEPSSVHGRLAAALQAVLGAERPDWEPRAREGLHAIGFRLVRDDPVVHPMEHATPEEYFDRLADSGPLRALARQTDPQKLSAVRARWLTDHGLVARGGRWTHEPAARLWVLEAEGGSSGLH